VRKTFSSAAASASASSAVKDGRAIGVAGGRADRSSERTRLLAVLNLAFVCEQGNMRASGQSPGEVQYRFASWRCSVSAKLPKRSCSRSFSTRSVEEPDGIQGHLAATGWWERFPPRASRSSAGTW
jgi:hypothetical protein